MKKENIETLNELIEDINIFDSLDDKDKYINMFLFYDKEGLDNRDYYFDKYFEYLIDLKNNKEDINILYDLAMAYEEKQDYIQAFNHLLKAIKFDTNDDFKAVIYNKLGEYYLEGKGTNINYQEAYNCFEKGINISKFIMNKLYIADMYYEGYIKRNYRKAFLLYLECLKDTYEYPKVVTNTYDRYKILYKLGRSYYYGLGVKENIDKAYGYMTDALREGYEHIDYDEEREDAINLYYEIRKKILLR